VYCEDTGKCYSYHQRSTATAVNWQDARQACRDGDGDLVTIPDLDINRVLRNLVPDFIGPLFTSWIGATNVGSGIFCEDFRPLKKALVLLKVK